VLEIGCGAGLGTVLAASRARSVIGIDISLEAVRNTKKNIKQNHQENNAEAFQTDLMSAVSTKSKFSVIMFNPPYLPEDESTTTMDHAHIGGEQGSEIAQRCINQASKHLYDEGRFYVVVSNLANIDAIVKTFEAAGFQVEFVAEKSLFFEKIQVIKGTFEGHKETVL